jgi:hypothetical protein
VLAARIPVGDRFPVAARHAGSPSSLAIVALRRFFPANPPVPFPLTCHHLVLLPLAQMDPAALTHAAAATLPAAIAVGVLLACRTRAAQTTLLSAWWWSLAALIAWWAAEMAAMAMVAGLVHVAMGPLRVGAIALSFCPLIAVLGAKRPQDRAWNLVVVSLYGIVALPAAEALFLHPAQRVEMGDARGWFLWILILLGPINYVPTRYWLASLLLATAQVAALSPYLAPLRRAIVPAPELTGLWLAGAAIVVAWLTSRRGTRAKNSYVRLWLDFRDAVGLLWALRVQERVNAAAQQFGWNLELTWGGFLTREAPAPLTTVDPTTEPALKTTLRGLLRRFVSGSWIAVRLH